MKVFISWSGDVSRALAEGLQVWLPRVLLNGIETFVSSQDIEKGQRGLSVIAGTLGVTDYGIVLLTRTNQHAPWINFEAGALGKSVGEARVSPLLVDLTKADVTGPLQQFQMTSLSDIEDLWKLLCDMNKLVESPLPEGAMKVLFNEAWPDLEAAITTAQGGTGPAKTERDPGDILDEILFRVRRLEGQRSEERLGPTGLSRTVEERLIGEVFSAISAPGAEVRGGAKVGRAGVTISISAPPTATVDVDELRAIAERNDIRIEIAEHNILIEPNDSQQTGRHE